MRQGLRRGGVWLLHYKLSPSGAGESHMDLPPLLHSFARWILRTAPTRRRESDGEVQEGFSTFGGSAGGQRAARFGGGIGHRLGGGAVRSRDLLGYGGVWTSQGRGVGAVLHLGAGVPSPDTFSRVFRLLEPGAFEAAFRRFMAAFAKTNRLDLTGVVAIDGKALRGAFERGSRYEPLHMVNVWAVEARMSLAQQKAPGRNETAGALEVLALLSLEGCIVTADALHCHRAMAKTVLDRGGDYVLAIKANRGPLFKVVVEQFARSGKRSAIKKVEPSTHDRRESRRATIMRNTSLA